MPFHCFQGGIWGSGFVDLSRVGFMTQGEPFLCQQCVYGHSGTEGPMRWAALPPPDPTPPAFATHSPPWESEACASHSPGDSGCEHGWKRPVFVWIECGTCTHFFLIKNLVKFSKMSPYKSV